MNLQVSTESYLSNTHNKFHGVPGHYFNEGEYNPNVLNDSMYPTVKNENNEKIQKNMEGFQVVYNKLFNLSKKYGLGSISIEKDIDDIYTTVFVITIPEGYDFSKALTLWDDVIDEVDQYCTLNGFDEYFENILIILK